MGLHQEGRQIPDTIKTLKRNVGFNEVCGSSAIRSNRDILHVDKAGWSFNMF